MCRFTENTFIWNSVLTQGNSQIHFPINWHTYRRALGHDLCSRHTLTAGRKHTGCSFFSMSLVQTGTATAMTSCLSCHFLKYS